jgi:hypothetical protein
MISAAEARNQGTQTVAPRLVLDGYGVYASPSATARPVPRNHAERASEDHPPGFYGPVDSGLSVNALVAGDRLAAIDFAPLKAQVAPLEGARTVDLRAPLLTLALALFLIDTLVSLWVTGHLGRLIPAMRRAGPATAALALALLVGVGSRPALGQQSSSPPPPETAAPLTREASQAALATRLAYVITGDAQIDATSKAGLLGLTQILASRTALEPGEPAGIDLAATSSPSIPCSTGRSSPPPDAERGRGAPARRLHEGRRHRGLRHPRRDEFAPGGSSTAEGQFLRRCSRPSTSPTRAVPRDHVLTKTFYLVDSFPGRFATGQTWVEALPPATEGDRRPARPATASRRSSSPRTTSRPPGRWASRGGALPGDRLRPAPARNRLPRRRQHGHVRADRQLQGRPGARAGPARAAGAMSAVIAPTLPGTVTRGPDGCAPERSSGHRDAFLVSGLSLRSPRNDGIGPSFADPQLFPPPPRLSPSGSPARSCSRSSCSRCSRAGPIALIRAGALALVLLALATPRSCRRTASG